MEEELQQSLEPVHKGYERAWTLTGSDQAGHERFKQLARRAIADLGQKFPSPDEAADNWLELVFEYWKAGHLHDEDDWWLKQVAEKSALNCVLNWLPVFTRPKTWNPHRPSKISKADSASYRRTFTPSAVLTPARSQ